MDTLAKKMGRPLAENPRIYRVDVRLTPEEFKILDDYCKKNNVRHPQALRDGIKALNKK